MIDHSNNYLWNSGFHFGDWLFCTGRLTTMMEDLAVTDKYMIAQCFYANSVQLLINAANVLVIKPTRHFYCSAKT